MIQQGVATLAPGQLLAGRYRVVRALGRGAVGEVYEAQDLELDERVAVKILRPEIAGSDRTLQRFKREIQLAHKVTHPNVCRVFDLVYHGAPEAGAAAGGTGGLAFLTMELLAGESLAELLARRGRLPPAEALPIVRQMAAALSAAHAVGVVHRDLKSGNVLLVEATGGRRVVVTDFGLAVSPLGEAAASLTATGELVGSPAYMAPEQVRGEEPTPATDVYALGVVLFEMVTGALPFAGKSAFYTALKRLQEPPPSPRTLVPELGPAWEAAILRCLAREPGDRFASAGEVAAAVAAAEGASGASALAETSAPALPAGRRRAWWPRGDRRLRAAALVAAPAVLLLALLGAVALLRDAEREPPAAGTPRLAVAVLGFRNATGAPDVDHLGSALRHMLPTELAATGMLRPVPAEEVERARRDLALEDSAGLSPTSLSRLRARLSADLVVTGAYVVAGEEARYAVQAQDTRTGETVASFSESGPLAGFPATLEGIGSRLRTALDAGDLPAATAALRAGNPRHPMAARLYAEGLSALDASEAPRARGLLVQAVAREPDNPRIHAALATAWADLGYDQRARREARTAWQLGAGLPPEERAAIEARHRELAGEWEAAIAIYRRLLARVPGDLGYGLRLAAAQTAAGRGGEALATIAALQPRAAGPPDPRLDLAEARAAASRSDFRAQQAAAERAAAAAAAVGARFLYARAKLEEGIALQEIGEHGAATAALDAARRLAQAADDRRGEATAIFRLGVVRYWLGDFAASKRLVDEARAAYRALGSAKGEAEGLNFLGNVALQERDLPAARRLYEAALGIYREVQDALGVGKAVGNLGTVSFYEGDLEQAQGRYEEAVAALSTVGDRARAAGTSFNLANVLLRRGDLAATAARLRSAYRTARELGDRSYRPFAMCQTLGDVHLQQGHLAAAAEWYAEMTALEDEQSPEARGRGRLARAELALAQGNMAAAEALAREAVTLLGGVASDDAHAEKHTTLVRLLLAQDRFAEAATEAARAAERARATGDPWPAVRADLVGARVEAARGRLAAARARLLAVRDESRRAGYAGLELEARLALAEVRLLEEGSAPARADLEVLVVEARRAGFALLARNAERLLAAVR